MSVTLVSNPYLDENSTKIRNKNVPWDVSLDASYRTTKVTDRTLGIPTRGPNHRRGAWVDQESRPPAPRACRVRSALRR